MDQVHMLTPDRIDDANELRAAYKELRRDGHTVRCATCNSETMTPDLTLAAWPRPWLEISDPAVLCHECWANEAADMTVLDEDQAKVIAVQALGYDRHEMASAIGQMEDDVDEYLREMNQLRREVEDEMDDLMRTAQLFDEM